MVVRLLEIQKKWKAHYEWLASLPEGTTAISIDPDEEDD